MNIETANEIRDGIRQASQEIRVLCPKGHFIAHIGLYVPGAEYGINPETAPVRMHPRGPQKQYVGDFSEGSHGLRMDLGGAPYSYNVRLRCMNSRCRYSGSFNFITLALELAEQALAGRAEYRLTT